MGNNVDVLRKKILMDGEKILWEGRPRKIQFFENPHTMFIAIRWLIAVAIFGLSMKYWNYAPTVNVSEKVRTSTTVFMMFVATLIALRPYLNVRNLEKNLRYVITNKRVIAYKIKGHEDFLIQSRLFENITEATIEYKENNMGDLYIGPKSKTLVWGARRDLQPVVREEDYILPMTFYNFYQPEKAATFLPSFIAVKNLPETPTEPETKNSEQPELPKSA